MTHLTRRSLVAASAGLVASAATRPVRAQAVPPITIVINQSPWFEGFRRAVQRYQETTGAQVQLDVNPLGGSIEKQRAAVRAGTSPFDVLIINNGFFVDMYAGGFLKPLDEVDPSFKLDPAVYTLDDTVYWNPDTSRADAATGRLMTVPINPNIPLLYYRQDLYAENELKVPETFDELRANAEALHSPPRSYGIVQRGARGAFDITYDFFPYLRGFGGRYFADERNGDYAILINGPEAKAALDYYIELAAKAGHPRTASQSQSDVIQNLVTGKAGHALLVIAAWAQMDDPNKSAVPGTIGFALPPHAPGFPSAPPLGHWLGGIPRNISADRQKAALDFLRWFQTREAQVVYAEAGSPPVRRDVLASDMAGEPRFRWMKPLADGLAVGRNTFFAREAPEIVAASELRLNQAVAGEVTAAVALNGLADDIETVMKRAGHQTARLEPLQ